MIKNKFTSFYKSIGLGLMIIFTTSLVSCFVNAENNEESGGNVKVIKDSEYTELALKTLEERYGEKFEIKQLGGTFGATNDTKKLVCYPVNAQEKYCFVEVENDLSQVYDTYINRIMEEKLNSDITTYVKDVFGENVIVKSMFNDEYNNYTTIDMDIKDFMNENSTCAYILDIFIDGGANLNKSEEANKIEKFANYLLEENISNNNYINIWYTKKETYKNVDGEYYDLRFSDNFIKYYKDQNKIYNKTSCEIQEKKVKSLESDIENDFAF